MKPNLDPDLDLRLTAYLDGELDAIAATDVEERLAADPTVAAAFARLSALRQLLRADRDTDVPPPRLAQRIATAVSAPRATRFEARWGALAAAVVAGVFTGAAASVGILTAGGGEKSPLADQLVANNLRALMAADPVQVASSDRHTVKPWFDGKLTFAPNVIDLADQGFPLIGGRVDIVDFMPAASLVYRYNQHLITVTQIPSSATLAATAAPATDRGFLVRTWRDGALAYWVVSDVNAAEMDAFVRLFRAAAAAS